jgi:hypothetical protein
MALEKRDKKGLSGNVQKMDNFSLYGSLKIVLLTK